MKINKIKIVKGKWVGSLILIDININLFRQHELIPIRSKISKENNYKFKEFNPCS